MRETTFRPDEAVRVVCTAGHIDHGKSALVRALTGTDPDRLAEEQRRGMTIDLGFAHLPRSPGPSLAFVDVPGHERFVRTMVAGASGVDAGLLVVAADEGVMQQTREHLDVLTLLGVSAGVVAITKADLLPSLGPSWLELLEEDISESLTGTPFANAPRIFVSAKTGEGLHALEQTLADAAAGVPPRRGDGPLLLPVDRAFAIQGFGAVVTGTLLSGSLRVGDEVELLPGDPVGARVRGLQSHGSTRDAASAGERVAVNLAQAPLERLHRGLAVVRPEELQPTRRLDVELHLLASAAKELRSGAALQLHLGTSQVGARVILADAPTLEPGETTWAQLRLAAPVVALPRQRFLLRGPAALQGRGRTVAGGTIVSTAPPRRWGPAAATRLERLLLGTDGERLTQLLMDAGVRGASVGSLQVASVLPRAQVEATLVTLGARGVAHCFDRTAGRWISGDVLQGLMDASLRMVDSHHEAAPLSPGLSKEELRTRLGVEHPKLFALLATRLAAAGLTVGPSTVSSSTHRPNDDTEALETRLLDTLRAGQLTPPDLRALADSLGEDEEKILGLLRLLERKERVVRVAHHLYYEAAALQGLRVRLVEFLLEAGSISTQEFKDLTGTSRKWLIPLGEHFDMERITLRTAEATRILRGERGAWVEWLREERDRTP